MNGTCRIIFVGLCLIVIGISAVPVQDCDKSKCKGPIKFYEDLDCKPVYDKEGDCCASRYDCTHLTVGRSNEKCYVNGHEYKIGEELKDEDRSSPCDKCTCSQGYMGPAQFSCVIFDCFNQAVKEGCYFKRDRTSCCGGEEICPKTPEERFKCEVDGETYLDDQEFTPKSAPDMNCICSEGYKGENVAPFCKPAKCGMEIRRSTELSQNCTPVFYPHQSARFDCHAFEFRCQNNNDALVLTDVGKSPGEVKEVPEEMKCKFGNMSMNIGEELNQATDYSSVCTKCICEVPPMPTCQKLPESECDPTNHPAFAR